MFFQDASVSIFGSKIVETWTPKSFQIAPKSKPTAAAEAIGKKIDFETHVGTFFHRCLVDFGDHFCCRPHRFAKLSCEAAKSKNYGKNKGFCIKNDIFAGLTSIQNSQKNGLRRRSGSTSKTMIKKRRIRCQISSHFGAKIGPSSLQNRSEN